MSPNTSCVVDALAPQDGRSPRALVAYGGDDDPLRLTVLLAAHVRNLLPMADEASVCLDPRAGWRARLEALRDLLRAVPASAGRHAAVVDIDALHTADTTDWEEEARRTPKRAFFDAIAGAPGLWLVRTSPTATVTRALEERGLDEAPNPRAFVVDSLAALAPECRDVAAWLLARGHLRERDLDRIVDGVRDFDDHILMIAYGSLSPSARRSAAVLSAVRAPAHVNGSFGPLAWRGSPSASGVPRADVDELAAIGFLRADDPSRGADLRMPRRVRQLVGLTARLDAALVRSVHAHAAAGDFERQSLSEQLETHHHAVRANDVERAKATARHYGVELRDLATRLSTTGKDWPAAAALYRHIIDTFDRDDAFVWEYWAFNLARWDNAEHASGRHEQQIREGYAQADQITQRRNPLYRGRLLGYRAERGDDIAGEFNRGMTGFLRDYAGQEERAISRFADAVFDGLRRSGQRDLRRRLFAQWRTSLERFAPRVIDKNEG